MGRADNAMIKRILRFLLSLLYRVHVEGLEHFRQAGERVLVVANHTSFLDPLLLWAFLPEEITFAINTHIARSWWVKPTLRWVHTFPMDPLNPLSVKALTHYLRQNRKAVVFPEGRITVTGSLMKIYDGSGLVADKAQATVLPIRIDGAQYTPFSRLKGVVRLRWFPRITLNILPPRELRPPSEVQGQQRRHYAGLLLSDLMSEMVFATGNFRRTLFAALLDARRVHGGGRIVFEDLERNPVTYNCLIAQILVLAARFQVCLEQDAIIGILLPTSIAAVTAFFGLQLAGCIPAMLNFSAGAAALQSAYDCTAMPAIVTSRRFVAAANLADDLAKLEHKTRIVYLEDLLQGLSTTEKVGAWLGCLSANYWYRPSQSPDAPAVILFTSGSEGTPKGVALSHANLLTNREQLAARVDFGPQDILLNALPLFHSFGLTAGTLLPLLSGMRTFLYPSPLHYRIIPEIAYDINATILFGTNTFLAGYGKYAHPYDFYSLRYAFAGAEKLQPETRRLWAEKFGIRIMEGYGVTETSPALAVNTPMHYRAGTVGRFLPGIRYRLEPIPGIAVGGRLWVRGPNVMLGYLDAQAPGRIEPLPYEGWYDTGDVVEVDADGFVTVKGRAKRFAKVGGEMVSLAAVEELAARVWPDAQHAALSLPDRRTGERIILFTDCAWAERGALIDQARAEGVSELHLPKEIRVMQPLPLLATGKMDYRTILERLREEMPT
jgi:acyl-[acyl-carrier-protein]-phospholipid O-acyltransferase/long-chain-fatty-acid--[acyl-carrier-protein] ligase